MAQDYKYDRLFDGFARLLSCGALLLSCGALLLAGAAVYLTWQDVSSTATSDDVHRLFYSHINELDEQESLASAKRQEQFETALRYFKQSMDAAVTEAGKPIVTNFPDGAPNPSGMALRNTTLAEESDLQTDQPIAATEGAPSLNAHGGQDGDAESEVQDTTAVESVALSDFDLSIPVPQAHLFSTRTTLQPADGVNSVVFQIENGGQLDAEIREIRFQPYEVIKVDLQEIVASEVDFANLQMIRFGPEHNQTSREGRQGIYQRELYSLFPPLPAGDRQRVLVAVVNPKHVGWGLVGDINIFYNSDDDLTIKAATVLFLAK